MKEEALKVGCVRAEISSHLDSSSSNVQSGCGPRVLVPSGMAGLLLGYALASSLGSRFFPRTRRLSCILLGTLWNSWQQPAQLGAPRNTTFDIGIDISFLHCVWDSLTHNKDNTEGVVSSLSSKKKKKSLLGRVTDPAIDFLSWHRTVCCVVPWGWRERGQT